MGRELGRISGPLLADNLKRNGSTLAFETKLLYLNVLGTQIGVNTIAPAYTIDIFGTSKVSNIIVGTQANLSNLEFYTNNIQTVVGNIVISPNQASDPTTLVPQLQATNLFFSGNTLSNLVTNADINFGLAVGNTTGQIKLNNNVIVDADLHATGNITWDGNITLGDNQAQDTVSFGAQINSDILPSANTTYNLGNNTTPLKWATSYVNTITTVDIGIVNVSTTNLTGSGTNLLNNNVTIGTTSSNTLAITAKINGNLIPLATNTYNLGSSTGPKYWNNIYGVTFNDSNITVTSNTIQTNTTDSSLRLIANGSGKVIFSKLNVTNNVTVGGTLGVTGTSTLTDTITGVITQTGTYNQTGDFTTTGTISSGSIISPSVTFPDFVLADSIRSTGTSTNLILTPYTGKVVRSTGDVLIDVDATATQSITVNGLTSLTDTSVKAITSTNDFNQTGNSTLGIVTAGSISASSVILPQVTISNNVITGTANSNLQITPYSGQNVKITTDTQFDHNVSISDTLGVTGTTSLSNTTITGPSNVTQTGDFNQTGNFNHTGTVLVGGNLNSQDLILTDSGNYLQVGNFKISGHTILGTATNNNITFTANGTGRVLVEGIGFSNNNIISKVSNTDILLTPNSATNKVVINTTKSLKLANANDTDQVLMTNGQIRFNNLNNNFEGYSSTGYVNFINLYSQDYQTYISPELTPGAGDNTIRFVAGSNPIASINSDALTASTLVSGNVTVSGNNIYNTNSSTDITVTGNGTGVVNINNTNISGSNVNSASMTLGSTNLGYYKFGGTNGVSFPVGTTAQRPTNPEVGTVRYNIDLSNYEVYDNQLGWIPWNGVQIDSEQVVATAELWALILGL